MGATFCKDSMLAIKASEDTRSSILNASVEIEKQKQRRNSNLSSVSEHDDDDDDEDGDNECNFLANDKDVEIIPNVATFIQKFIQLKKAKLRNARLLKALRSRSRDNNENFMMYICEGDFSFLPEPMSNTIRVFLCSTTKDYRIETNYLVKAVYTHLREYFRKRYAFDFILIDLRWGMPRNHSLSNLTTIQFRINEVKRCVNESIGPAFLAFVSHRYGTVQLREEIEKSEFEAILQKADKVLHDGIDLIEYCYELDENDVNEENKLFYKLKSMKELFNELPNFKDVWKVEEVEMLKGIQNGAKRALTTSQSRKYFVSGTAEEIFEGVLNNPTANESSLVFFRSILHAEDDVELMKKRGYLDRIECDEWVEQLKSIEACLREQNKIDFEIDWLDTNCFDADSELTSEYLREFEASLKKKTDELIQQAIKKSTSDSRHQLTEHDIEIINHASYCNNLLKNFVDRNEYSQKIQKYVNDPQNNKPFLIYGPMAVGKSSILADVVQEIRSETTIVAVRFLGTTRLSSDIFSVLNSLIHQFRKLFSIRNEVIEDDLKTPTQVMDYFFSEVINEVNVRGQNIVIVLDSIDQLHGYDLSWITHSLPPKVKIIFSSLPGLVKKIKGEFSINEDNFVEIRDLTVPEAVEQLVQQLFNKSRQLQQKQWNLVLELLNKVDTIFPLHVKLLFDICLKWRSTYKFSYVEIVEQCRSLTSTIQYLFKRLEAHYGSVLIRHFVFYLTIFKNGVSESELEDILSLDDLVLNELFNKYEPPIRRFPSSVLLRLLHDDLSVYLIERQIDGVVVFTWLDRVFYEVTREVYKDMFERTDRRDVLLMNVVDYFEEKWRERPKEYKVRIGKKICVKEATRYTKSQSIKFKTPKENFGSGWIYNHRKLNEFQNIVFMLKNEETKVQYLTNSVYLNPEFIHSKAKLNDLRFLVENEDLIEELHDKVINDPRVSKNVKVNAARLLDISCVYVDNLEEIGRNPDVILHKTSENNEFAQKLRQLLDDHEVNVERWDSESLLEDEVLCGYSIIPEDEEIGGAGEFVDKKLKSSGSCSTIITLNDEEVKTENLTEELELKSDEEKIDYLIESVYLNHELMNFKAQLNELDFVLDMHDYIEKLHERVVNDPAKSETVKARATQLLEMSSIYVENYEEIVQSPESAQELFQAMRTTEFVRATDVSEMVFFENEVDESSLQPVECKKCDDAVEENIHTSESTMHVLDGIIEEETECEVMLYESVKGDSLSRTSCCKQNERDERNSKSNLQTSEMLNDDFYKAVFTLSSDEDKVDYLTNRIYLNHEFVHSKAKSNEFNFVLDAHEYIVSLHEKLINDPDKHETVKMKATSLLEISCIYVDNYDEIIENPDLILYKTISRVGSEESAQKLRGSMRKKDFAMVPILSGFENESQDTAANVLLDLGDSGEIYFFVDDEHLLVKLASETTFELAIVNVVTQEIRSKSGPISLKCSFIGSNLKIVLFRSTEFETIEGFFIENLKLHRIENIDETIWSDEIKYYFLENSPNQFICAGFHRRDKYFEIVKYKLNEATQLIQMVEEYNVDPVDSVNLPVNNPEPFYFLTFQSNHLLYLSVKSEQNQDRDQNVVYEVNCIDMSTNKRFKQFDLSLNLHTKANNYILSLRNEDDFIVYAQNNTSFSHYKINSNLELTQRVVNITRGRIKYISPINATTLLIECIEDNNECMCVYDIPQTSITHSFDHSGQVAMNSKYIMDTHPRHPIIRAFQLNSREKVLALPLKHERFIVNERYASFKLHTNKLLTFLLSD